MVTRYFDVDPLAVGLAYGFNEFIGERRRLDEINRQKNLAKKARRKKNLITGLTAAAGAVALPLAAPALGLAGAAGAAGAPLAAGGTALGTVGATAGTAGMFGVGGALTGAGTLAAGLTGAGIGANVGSALAEGDVGQAIGSFAGPMAGMYGVENNRRMAADDRASRRSENIADALYLDNARTEGNIKQAQALYDIQNYGMPGKEYAELSEIVGGGQLDAAESMPNGIGPPSPYSDPMDDPYVEGPSRVPGMDKKFTGHTLRAMAKTIQQEQSTLGNPEWINAATPDRIESQRRSIERAKKLHRTSLVPKQPQPMTFDESGNPVPMRLGWNKAPDGGYSYLGPDGKQQHIAPPKGETDPQTPWESAPTAEAAELAKMADFKAKTVVDEKGQTWKYDPKQRDWEPVKVGGDGDGGSGFDAKIFTAAMPKGENAELNTDALVDNYEKISDAKAKIDARIGLKEDIFKAVSAPLFQPISREAYASLLAKAVAVYGRNPNEWPEQAKEEKEMLERLDARLNPRGTRRLVEGPR